MNIEEKIFRKTKVNYEKLIQYGFKFENGNYKYTKKLLDGFEVCITFENNRVFGKIIDTNLNEEYINYRIESQDGAFVNKIRNEYEQLLNDVLNNCFDKLYFFSNQANRIADIIFKTYNNRPEFLFEKSPNHGVFREENSDKWYALIMNIDKSKLNKNLSGEVEIINVKVDSSKITELMLKKGFYPSYHMNKKNWISIVLDETVPDNEIIEMIKKSHDYLSLNNEWIIPANPKFYDVINCFNNENIILWKQSNDIKIGDIIYIYVASPYSKIFYKCEAVEVNIPYQYKDKNLSINRAMKIKLLEKYDEHLWTFKVLNECGINAIRGPRKITEKLSQKLKEGPK